MQQKKFHQRGHHKKPDPMPTQPKECIACEKIRQPEDFATAYVCADCWKEMREGD